MPELPTDAEQLRRIREFLSQLQQLLKAVVDQPYNILPGRHHDSIRQAWDEVSLDFKSLISSVTDNQTPDLKAAGLQGYKLIFEIGVFDHARAELLDHAPEIFALPDDPSWSLKSQPPKEVGFWAMLRRLFRRCLKAGDVVLGSLAKIPAFAPAEIIKQFKEGVEEAVALKDILSGEQPKK
jgi:hypothetical protein